MDLRCGSFPPHCPCAQVLPWRRGAGDTHTCSLLHCFSCPHPRTPAESYEALTCEVLSHHKTRSFQSRGRLGPEGKGLARGHARAAAGSLCLTQHSAPPSPLLPQGKGCFPEQDVPPHQHVKCQTTPRRPSSWSEGAETVEGILGELRACSVWWVAWAGAGCQAWRRAWHSSLGCVWAWRCRGGQCPGKFLRRPVGHSEKLLVLRGERGGLWRQGAGWRWQPWAPAVFGVTKNCSGDRALGQTGLLSCPSCTVPGEVSPSGQDAASQRAPGLTPDME